MKVSNEMVQRFLGWRLPDDFYPDGGVTFNREVNGGLRPKTWWPVGTNLLTDPQARAMLEHVVGPEFDALLARCEAVEARLAEAHDLLALAAAAQAVVDRWDTPLWKDAEPTAEVINRLRRVLEGER